MNDVGKQEHKEKKAAVILAAGSGRRMNTPVAKQFPFIYGRSKGSLRLRFNYDT